MDELLMGDLVPSERVFAQDDEAWVPRRGSCPGCRRLAGVRIVTVRHAPLSGAARAALERRGLPWPELTGELRLVGGPPPALLTRRQPEEVIVVDPSSSIADALLASFSPGQSPDAAALDLSHGMTVVALEGPGLDSWLSHLVDASAVPRRVGTATRTRLIDVAVVLLRLADDTVWLVADRALSPYLAKWLAFTHEGAFSRAVLT
jgi:heterotetrameric sarcosine oxidase gamma subunit